MKSRLRWLVAALALSLTPAMGAKVPAVTAGPDVFVTAQAVEAPIQKVTVFSDRARVDRRGKAPGGTGVRAVRLPDLPGATMLDSIRVSAKGAEVLRVQAVPVEQPRAAIGQAADLVDQLEAIALKLARHDARRAVLHTETQFLDALAPKPLPDEDDRKATPKVDPNGWLKVRGFVQQRRAALVAELRAMDREREAVVKGARKLQTELARFRQEAFTRRRTVQVVALIDAQRGAPEVAVQYFVPGASWRPAYTTELVGNGRKLSIRTAGRVNQATGEDWDDVELALSTAIPGQGIEAPKLLTWTLGEAKDFTPRPQPKQRRNVQILPPPQARQTPAEVKEAMARNSLQQRINRALQVGQGGSVAAYAGDAQGNFGGVFSGKGVGDAGAIGGLGVIGMGAGGGGSASGRGYGRGGAVKRTPRPRRSRASAAPPPPMAAPAPAMEMDAMLSDDGLRSESISVTSGSLSRKPRPRRVGLDLFEPPPPRRQTFNDPTLPAVVAGGLDYVYTSTTRVTVPSSPEQHTVPLSAETYPVQPFYEASPALEPTAFLKATVKNRGDKPLLGGPVDIFVGADYVGSGQIDTTGVGGDVSLPLGADPDIKFARRLIPKTKTEGVFSKDDITGYRTEIDVVNNKRRSISVRVVEQFPISDVEDLKIERGKLSQKPSEGPDDTGIMAFQVDLKPGQKKTIEFSYRIKRPANWKLYQR